MKQHFDTLVVGAGLTPDGTELTTGTRAALRQAGWLATELGARVVLVHTADHDLYFDRLNRRWSVVSEGTTDAGRAALEGAAEELRAADVAAEIVYGEEKPWIEVTRVAQRHPRSLVLVGRHDDPDEEVHKLGSVSTKLLAKCPRPVWVVRPGTDPKPARIVAATDLTPVGDVVTSYAADLAALTKAELWVAHFYQVPMQLQMESGREPDPESAAHVRQLEETAREAIGTELARAGVQSHTRVVVACHSPARGIAELVEGLDPDLVVMGTVSRGGLAGLLIGSTAERLVGRLPCSLLTVKPEDFVSPIR